MKPKNRNRMGVPNPRQPLVISCNKSHSPEISEVEIKSALNRVYDNPKFHNAGGFSIHAEKESVSMIRIISGLISLLSSGATITAVNTIPFSIIQEVVLWVLSTTLLVVGFRMLLFSSHKHGSIYHSK